MVCTPILKISSQQNTNLVWFILWLIVSTIAFEWTEFHKELSFLKNVFFKKKTGTICNLLITLLLLLPYLGKISLQPKEISQRFTDWL